MASPTPSEIRTQAVAKLKRAASIPRTPQGRRPSQRGDAENGDGHMPSGDGGPSVPVDAVSNHYGQEDRQEMLAPSPQPSSSYDLSPNRDLSASPTLIPSPLRPLVYSQSPSPTPDRSGYHLFTGSSPSQQHFNVPGRSTPSPLPTLGELRNLSRSNSTAARANAMKKLMGDSSTPDAPIIKPSLQRADSLGAPAQRYMSTTMVPSRSAGVDVPSLAVDSDHEEDAFSAAQSASQVRLGRSHTVGAGGGEERRSAVGRRMMARLGNRAGTPASNNISPHSASGSASGQESPSRSGLGRQLSLSELRARANLRKAESPSPTTVAPAGVLPLDPEIPCLVHPSSTEDLVESPVSTSRLYPPTLGEALALPSERSASRSTNFSTGTGEEAFEYEHHLRRSFSNRTARNAELDATPGDSEDRERESKPLQASDESVETILSEPAVGQFYDTQSTAQGLPLPQPPFYSANATLHTPRASTSTAMTDSPGGSSSTDVLGQMVFTMGGRNGSQSTRGFSAGSFPVGIDDSPGRDWTRQRDDLTGVSPDASPNTSRKHSLASHQPSEGSSTQDYPRGSYASQPSKPPSAYGEHFERGHGSGSGDGRRSVSAMSWEEIPGPQDLGIPNDRKYHQKSDSMVSKIERSLRGTLRKGRRGSASTNTSNGEASNSPASPLLRRGSEASSVSHAPRDGIPRDDSHSNIGGSRKQSYASLTPPQHYDSRAGSILSVPATASGKSSPLPMPVVDAQDSRYLDSKLSPFPGMVQLEQERNRKRSEAGIDPTDPPHLVHQYSDPVVSSIARPLMTSAESTFSLPSNTSQAQYFDLPTGNLAELSSTGRKGWLAKAFGQPTTKDRKRPSISESLVRKISGSDLSLPASPDIPSSPGDSLRRKSSQENMAAITSSVMGDPFAAAPMKPLKTTPTSRHRSASPTVSVVHEGSEEGSRWTKFSTMTAEKGNPNDHSPLFNVIREYDGPASPRSSLGQQAESSVPAANSQQLGSDRQTYLPPKSVEVLKRLDAVLSLSGDDPARPSMLDDPPRKLLLCTQVLQVVNSNTVKDRYLFLFTDILVIAKPLLVGGEPANLDMKFVVKSIVSLDKLVVSGLRDEDSTRNPNSSRDHPIVQNFITQFAQDPVAAVDYLVERSNPKVDDTTLASLLFKTSELDKTQIGIFLSLPQSKVTLKAFIDRFHFVGVRIDDALRMFLLSLRLPTEANASELLLQSFANRWFEANQDTVAFDRSLAFDLVLAVMQLNDALHPNSGFGSFAFANQVISAEDFIGAFRAKDTRSFVPGDLLYDIYDSVHEDMLVQALPASRQDEARVITVLPANLPSKLTYMEWSDPIAICIPHPDSEFGLRLHGEGLEFDPPTLDFTTSATQTFRIRGTTLGFKSLLFDRVGHNAALYANLGNTRSFSIERAFMAHTFQVSFVNHLNTKRKYCFSVEDAETRRRWGQVLLAQIKRATAERSAGRGLPAAPPQRQVRQAAETVALQVLRDSLIGQESAASTSTQPENGSTPSGGRGGRGGRSGSISTAYAMRAGHGEVGLPHHSAGIVQQLAEKDTGLLDLQTGKELVLLCRQNSLLPMVLSFLQGGVATNSNVV